MTKQIATAQIGLAKIQPDALVAASNMLSSLGVEHSLSTSDYLPEMSDNPRIMAAILDEFPRNGDDCNTLLHAVSDEPECFWRIVRSAL